MRGCGAGFKKQTFENFLKQWTLSSTSKKNSSLYGFCAETSFHFFKKKESVFYYFLFRICGCSAFVSEQFETMNVFFIFF